MLMLAQRSDRPGESTILIFISGKSVGIVVFYYTKGERSPQPVIADLSGHG
ncbi:hypothetical protein VB712_19135 [Spirulina sp. CCNP1310]|uniref:hypothetical protein n=1 Tax=Spirulina sp. CCNP1310 TaxID=3110249 RepID=UPI002B20B7A7|nr:hypothetical protein [Spirulina sp. CCNP1310]MEA5421344.1 hypothetical protein [Spirulina sp. CCNP1310]